MSMLIFQELLQGTKERGQAHLPDLRGDVLPAISAESLSAESGKSAAHHLSGQEGGLAPALSFTASLFSQIVERPANAIASWANSRTNASKLRKRSSRVCPCT